MRRGFRLLLMVLAGIGTGAIAALAQNLGGSYNGPDQGVAAQSVQSALEYNRTNQAQSWVDPDSGVAGTTTPVRTFEGAAGKPCREFFTTIEIGGQAEQGYGTACRQPDGTWQIVDKSPPTTTSRSPVATVPPTTVYVYPQPSWPNYSRYGYGYDPAWVVWPWPPFYFSFDYVYHGGGHWGRYGGGDRYRGHFGRSDDHIFRGGDRGHGAWRGGGGGHGRRR